jgi:excisionase family DNA binding protein
MKNERKVTGPEWFMVKEVAARYKVHERSVRRWIKQGLLRAHKFGRAVRIHEKDLADFERKCGCHRLPY